MKHFLSKSKILQICLLFIGFWCVVKQSNIFLKFSVLQRGRAMTSIPVWLAYRSATLIWDSQIARKPYQCYYFQLFSVNTTEISIVDFFLNFVARLQNSSVYGKKPLKLCVTIIIDKSVFMVLCLLQCTRANAVPEVETKVSLVNRTFVTCIWVHEFHICCDDSPTTTRTVCNQCKVIITSIRIDIFSGRVQNRNG